MLVSEALRDLQILTNKHITQAEFARVLNVSPVSVYKKIIRNSELKVSEAELLEKHYNVSLLTGSNNSSDDNIELDYIHINPSCGRGTIVLDEAEVTPIRFSKSVIKNIWRISDPSSLKIFKASGDSMAPVIEDGDLVLIDTTRTDFNSGGIFLLTINNDWYIKRLRKRLSGELDVISDNDKYPIETFNQNDDIEILVKGRIIKNLSRGL